MKYSVGDEIVYRAFGGTARQVLVDDKDSDIKNGRPGFGGIVTCGPDKGMDVWGYDDQIVEVL